MKKLFKITLLIYLLGSSYLVNAQGLLGIGATGLTGLPDTARYGDTFSGLQVWIVNRGVLPLSNVVIQLMASPNQDIPFQLGTFDLGQLILAPGDSVQVPTDDYTVTPQNSGGGSNVIVIWPTAPGTQPTDSAGGTYWVDEITGLTEMLPRPSSGSLYPNPGSGIFQFKQVKGSWIGGSIQVYQQNGQVVATREVNATGILDFNDLPEGLYFYRVIGQERLLDMGKFLIQRN